LRPSAAFRWIIPSTACTSCLPEPPTPCSVTAPAHDHAAAGSRTSMPIVPPSTLIISRGPSERNGPRRAFPDSCTRPLSPLS
jgi:hypothetical protein